MKKLSIHIIAFGIAKDILGQQKLVLGMGIRPTVGDVRLRLLSQYAEFNKFSSLRFAVNEEYVDDKFQLHEGDEVIIIPPVSGG